MFEEILRFFRVRLEWSFRQRVVVIFLGPKFRSFQYLKVFISQTSGSARPKNSPTVIPVKACIRWVSVLIIWCFCRTNSFTFLSRKFSSSISSIFRWSFSFSSSSRNFWSKEFSYKVAILEGPLTTLSTSYLSQRLIKTQTNRSPRTSNDVYI